MAQASSSHKATVREGVGDPLFNYQAGSFSRIEILCSSCSSPPTPASANLLSTLPPPPTYLRRLLRYRAFRAHARSALDFIKLTGIELSADSTRFATHDVELDGLTHGISFYIGDATRTFGTSRSSSTRIAGAATHVRFGMYMCRLISYVQEENATIGYLVVANAIASRGLVLTAVPHDMFPRM
ncbi:hypothetical protein H4582DRAFT_2065244 [Lactarius indigo]|nr:hypothetical protein H4582DRAFT_2065244 [Lactarius indigo]